MEMTPNSNVPKIVDVRVQGLLKVLRLSTIAKHYDALARHSDSVLSSVGDNDGSVGRHK